MAIATSTLQAIADEFAAVHPELDARQQQVALAVFRLLGKGTPVDANAVAIRTGLPASQVIADLDAWPEIHRDDQGRIVGFWGLTLHRTRHAIEVDGHTLYTWCGLDALFVPGLLGRPATVRSTSPTSGQTVSLTVDADGPRDITPASAAMTLRRVTQAYARAWGTVDDQEDTREHFCHYVHFFASEDEAAAFAQDDDNTLVASVAEGFEYGRRSNHQRFGAALEADTPATPAKEA